MDQYAEQGGGTATAGSETRRGSGSLRNFFSWICATGFVLLAFSWGAHDFYQYRVGTPTTATVAGDCTKVTGGGKNCPGTWSIDGVSHSGQIKTGFRTPSAGSSLDVRVSGGTAYTADESLQPFALGGGLLLVISIVASVAKTPLRRRSQ
jgi:hypothetical protein